MFSLSRALLLLLVCAHSLAEHGGCRFCFLQTAVSDNGITNAQRFYVGCRPNEGLPALYRAPGTTYYGKRFQPQGVTTFQ